VNGRRTVWPILGLVAVVVGIGVLAAWGALAYTGSPQFCASCHVMETRYVSWQRSPHVNKATCIQCHSEPGPWGEFWAHVNGTRYLYVMLTGEKSAPILRAAVARATCEHCHRAEALPDATRTARIEHRSHLAREMECTACHAGLVHGSLYGQQAQPAARTCVNCHATENPVLARVGRAGATPAPSGSEPGGEP